MSMSTNSLATDSNAILMNTRDTASTRFNPVLTMKSFDLWLLNVILQFEFYAM